MSSVQPVNAEDLPKKLAEFLNDWPLYSPFRIRFSEPVSYVPHLPQTILRDCERCAATPTWAQRHPSNRQSGQAEHVGVGLVVAYCCTHCGKEELRVWFTHSEDRARNPDGTPGLIVSATFRKLGQWPAQRIDPSRALAKALNAPLLDMFKKGLTCLSHGFGLGALAYFRRIVEDASGELIDLFAAGAAAEGDLDAEQAIRAAKESRRSEERLKLASEALPTSLKPGGVNPLAVLYGHYSRGIHGLSDEECLNLARQLNFALEYIFRNWRTQMEEAAEFRRTVQRWGDSSKAPARGE